ncbi:MAG TPA: dTDP-4-dehydrorhamnose 3,5-epimerase [Vicinamibacteria bacterium]
MKASATDLPGLIVFEPVRHEDERGLLVETFKESAYREAGLDAAFVQDNLSVSHRGVLRGLHFQRRQGKLITVVEGEVQDVAVDIRPDSTTFGRWIGLTLSGGNHRQIYIPPGFAHGFLVRSERAYVWYKTTDVYRPEEQGGILWNDPDLAVDWDIPDPVVSDRDRLHPLLRDVDRSLLITKRELDGAGA